MTTTTTPTYGFQRLTAEGTRLVSPARESGWRGSSLRVSAKYRTGGQCADWFFIEVHTNKSGWTSMCFDEHYTLHAQGFGDTQDAAGEDLDRVLQHKGIPALRATAEDTA